MGHDRDAELSLVRARVREMVDRSSKLMARAKDRARVHEGSAFAGFVHAEAQLNHAADGLPGRYGLPPEEHRDVLTRLLEAAGSVYRGCRSISVASVGEADEDGRRRYSTPAATGRAGSLDAAQYALGEGPGLDALELDQVAVVSSDDLAGDNAGRAWPRFSAAAGALGIRSCVSVAIPWTRSRVDAVDPTPDAIGAINLYATEPRAFDEPEAHGLLLGAWAGAVLTGRDPAEIYDAIIWRPRDLSPEWPGSVG
ncbi:hypothetical protein LQ327_15135 [Actinomycetospora endophytica]|uniref:Uncharacterized protein n=1 Tax=Actinomycetospora endophytica TaxID=2291215 RepID=A0ABS8P8Y6_9PSEU|nr:hypothetical protein [Actinomycetospora endophytica]MCD2194706.1 hypothetical protein [Actinomycetospora endophytica]